MMGFAVPRWLWLVGGGAVVTVCLLLLYRAQLQKADARGYDRAMIEASQAAAAASAAYQAQVDAAEGALAQARQARRKAVATAREEARAYYQANPAAAGAVCLPADRVQFQNEARSRVHSSAAGGGRDPM